MGWEKGEFQEGGDIRTSMTDSCRCMAETNRTEKKKKLY